MTLISLARLIVSLGVLLEGWLLIELLATFGTFKTKDDCRGAICFVWPDQNGSKHVWNISQRIITLSLFMLIIQRRKILLLCASLASLVQSSTHHFTHSPTHSLSHPPTHLPTHSHTHSPSSFILLRSFCQSLDGFLNILFIHS